uniref:Putative secreted protein n=1 Tax=Anopheles darlingi TaxID=43151 RepID=A0A2M4D265_ANODA
MDLEVFGTREALATLAALVRFLLGVCAHVHQHLVACVKAPILAHATLPAAIVQVVQPDNCMFRRYMAG